MRFSVPLIFSLENVKFHKLDDLYKNVTYLIFIEVLLLRTYNVVLIARMIIAIIFLQHLVVKKLSYDVSHLTNLDTYIS